MAQSPCVAAVEHVTSADGTRIAFRRWGSGDPILFVHGSATSGADWLLVRSFIQSRFTVVAMDRRGRGGSENGGGYAMERETEDVLAVLDALGAELLVCHSYGALCSMPAAERAGRLRRLVVYEPPIAIPARGLSELEELVATDPGAALERFLRFAGARSEQVDAIRSSPAWPSLTQVVPTVPRELRAGTAWARPDGPIDVPTLWLQGTETASPVYLDGLEEVQRIFTDLRRESIQGQGHFAHVFAAEEFAARVAAFVGDGHHGLPRSGARPR